MRQIRPTELLRARPRSIVPLLIAGLAALSYVYWIPSGYGIREELGESGWEHLDSLVLALAILSGVSGVLSPSRIRRVAIAVGAGVVAGELVWQVQGLIKYPKIGLVEKVLSVVFTGVGLAVLFCLAFAGAYGIAMLGAKTALLLTRRPQS